MHYHIGHSISFFNWDFVFNLEFSILLGLSIAMLAIIVFIGVKEVLSDD
jgi:hypothetical protein